MPAAAQVRPLPSHRSSTPAPPVPAVVARVNGVAIGGEELKVAMNAKLPLTSYHQNVSPETLASVRREALDALIDEELRYQEAVRLKITVAPKEVEAALERARQAYKGREAFEAARRASGATLPQLRASIRRALLIQKVYEQAVLSRCQVTETEAAAFYRAQPARFVVPEQLRPSLITIGVSPSGAHEEWAAARQKAEDLARQIAAGASFEALARQHSTDPSSAKGGDLGFVHEGRLIPEFENALKTLRAGHVSGVVQTIYGYHLLRLIETRSPVQKSFAEVKESIVRDLTGVRCGEASAQWSKRLRSAARIEVIGESRPTRRAARSASR